MNSDNIVIFQHIAKTGGTSVGDALRQLFSVPEQLSIAAPPHVSALGTWSMESVRLSWEKLAPEERMQIRFVGGHLPFGVHEIFDRPAKYIAVLRDPVERVLSGFYYSIGQHFEATGESVSLEQYVFRAKHYDLGINNYQTRVVSGLRELDPFEALTTKDARPLTDQDLSIAIGNLHDHYLTVGLTEKSERFLPSFVAAYGRPQRSLPSLQKLNVTNARPLVESIDPRIIEEIRNHNKFDQKLYEFASREFCEDSLPE